jgi:hypothetical protein
MTDTKWARYDAARTRKRINLTLPPDVATKADRQAEARGLSLSYYLEHLILEEESRLSEKATTPRK